MPHCPQCDKCPECGNPHSDERVYNLQNEIRRVDARMRSLQNNRNKTDRECEEEAELQYEWDDLINRRANEQQAVRERILLNRKSNSRK